MARRTTDSMLGDIEGMIMAENDPEKRAMLIVLNAIAERLHDTSADVSEVSKKQDVHADEFKTHVKAFQAHIATEDQLLAQGRGAWRVGVWVMSILQIAVLSGIGYVSTSISGIHDAIHAGQIAAARIETRLQALEKKP